MASIINDSYSLTGWGSAFAASGRFPIVANTIFENYSAILTYATSNATAYAGAIVSALKDETKNNQKYPKGAYYIASWGEGAEVVPVGKDVDLSNYVTKDQISSVYTYKGSKDKYSELPTTDNITGDVWNVAEAYNNHPAGTNWVWTGTTWDALGGSVDLSNYALKADVNTSVETLTAGVAANLGHINSINEALTKKVDKVEGSSLIPSEKLALIDTNAADIQALENQNLDSRVSTLEGMFKDGDNNIDLSSISASITDHTTRITSLEADNTTNKTNISNLQNQANGHGERLTAIETLNTEQSAQIGGLTARVETVEAYGTAITNLTTSVNGHTESISALNTGVSEAKALASSEAAQALADAKAYVGEEIGKLSYDAAGSASAVEGKLNEEIARAQAAEKANADAIVVERGRIDALLTSEGVSDAVESFKELLDWIDNHEGGAADILAAANKAQEEVDALESVVSAMDAAYKTADALVLTNAQKYTDDAFANLGTAAYKDTTYFALSENTYTKTEVTEAIKSALSWQTLP